MAKDKHGWQPEREARLGRWRCRVEKMNAHGLLTHNRREYVSDRWRVIVYGAAGRRVHETDAYATESEAIDAARQWAGEQDGRDGSEQ